MSAKNRNALAEDATKRCKESEDEKSDAGVTDNNDAGVTDNSDAGVTDNSDMVVFDQTIVDDRGWRATFQRIFSDGAKSFSSLYDRQLRHRVAALKLGVQGKSCALEAELQIHAAYTASLLSAVLRFQDALEEVQAATEALQENMQQLYPGSSAVEPSRGMQDVSGLIRASVSAPAGGVQQMVEALQVHCDIALPAIQQNINQLRQAQDEQQLMYATDVVISFDQQIDNLDKPVVTSPTLGGGGDESLRVRLEAAHRQSGYLWDSLRLKLHRIVATMRKTMLEAAVDSATVLKKQ